MWQSCDTPMGTARLQSHQMLWQTDRHQVPHIDNDHSHSPPNCVQAGKALHSKRAEIRVQFRHVPGNLYRGKIMGDLDSTTNELVCMINRYPACVFTWCSVSTSSS